MRALLSRVFIDHPASVEETYFEHLRFAGWFAARLFAAGGAALVHAVIPCLFEKTTSNLIREMYSRINNR